MGRVVVADAVEDAGQCGLRVGSEGQFQAAVGGTEGQPRFVGAETEGILEAVPQHIAALEVVVDIAHDAVEMRVAGAEAVFPDAGGGLCQPVAGFVCRDGQPQQEAAGLPHAGGCAGRDLQGAVGEAFLRDGPRVVLDAVADFA
ncbi:hypothetical protein EOM89_10215, partial [Candidatus Falkowbacteria bacterium]|nr:hypothetical protein [Candidatus Falkowbacteria bacterium]